MRVLCAHPRVPVDNAVVYAGRRLDAARPKAPMRDVVVRRSASLGCGVSDWYRAH